LVLATTGRRLPDQPAAAARGRARTRQVARDIAGGRLRIETEERGSIVERC
jgi:hypothetical protein